MDSISLVMRRSYPSSVWLLLGLALFASACSDMGSNPGDAPDPSERSATWIGGIEDLMIDQCGDCHGEPAKNGAPDTFRLDIYDSSENDGNDGAFERRDRIEVRALNQKTMPPPSRTALSSADQALLQEWLDNGAPRE